MTSTPTPYHVTLTVNEEQDGLTEALEEALSTGGPFLATPLSVASTDGYVTIRFATVSDDPTATTTTTEHATPGAETVAALEGFSHEHTLTTAVLKALLTFATIRAGAGLAPRREVRIDAVVAPPLHPDSLSIQRSDAVEDAFPPFGGPEGGSDEAEPRNER